jgi:bis(5'-nucleosyl)-tetraphosphatase (symmetrical)
MKIIFGHWSTLGYYQDSNVLALDTGCVWGRRLSAVRIDIKEPILVQVDCKKSTYI